MKTLLKYILPVFLFTIILSRVLFNFYANLKNKQSEDYLTQFPNSYVLSRYYQTESINNPNNISAQFNYVMRYFTKQAAYEFDDQESVDTLIHRYSERIKHLSDTAEQAAKIALSLIYFYQEEYDKAFSMLKYIQSNSVYVNYILGKYYFNYKKDKAIYFLTKEIEINPSNRYAYHLLSELYASNLNTQELLALINAAKKQGVFESLAHQYIRKSLLKSGAYFNYIKYQISVFSYQLDYIALFASLCILLVWLYYLMHLYKGILRSVNWWVLALIGGLFMSFTSSIVVDVFKLFIPLKLHQDSLQDALYTLFFIAIPEEGVKIIPLLFWLKFKSTKPEPIHILIFACISALSFVLIENYLYFRNGGITNLHSRAISASLIHLFNSSLAAYGWVRYYYSASKNRAYFPIVFFMASCVLHAMYDYFLLLHTHVVFNFILLFYLLACLILWSSLLNNCINNSPSMVFAWTYHPQKLNKILLFGLAALFLIEFLLVNYLFGFEVAYDELKNDWLSAVFLLLFIGINFSSFDYIPNYWAPLKFWDWNLIFKIPKLKNWYPDYSKIFNQSIVLQAIGPSGQLLHSLPLAGIVRNRLLLNNEKNWFLVELNDALIWKNHKIEWLLLKLKNEDEFLFEYSPQLVKVRLVEDLSLLDERKKRKKDFPLVDYLKVFRVK